MCYILFILSFITFNLLNIKNLYSCESDSVCLSNTKTCFIPISQGLRLFEQTHIPSKERKDCVFGIDFSTKYFFQQSINDCQISNLLFQTNNLLFQGNISGTDTGRPSNALVPEYFGLAPDTDYNLCISPKIRNQILEFQASFNYENLWIQINAPVVFANWKISSNNTSCPTNSIGDIFLDEAGDFIVTNTGNIYNVSGNKDGVIPAIDNNTGLFLGDNSIQNNLEEALFVPPYYEIDNKNYIYSENEPYANVGYWNTPTYNSIDSLGNITDLNNQNNLNGEHLSNIIYPVADEKSITLQIDQIDINPAGSIQSAVGGYTFGDLQTRSYNLINLTNNSFNQKIGVADLQLFFGYDFYHCDKLQIGGYIRSTIPTGTNINSAFMQYVFSPIIGNGRHFGLGAGLTSNYYIYECNDSELFIHVDTYFMSLFSSNQFRTFDQNGNSMSRYAVVKKLQYTGNVDEFSDSFNYLGLNVLGDVNSQFIDITIPFSGEFIIDLIYSSCNNNIGIGYSLVGQSKENSCSINNCFTANTVLSSDSSLEVGQNYYGYKGDCPVSVLVLEGLDNTIYDGDVPLIPVNSLFYAKFSDNVIIGGTSGAYLYGNQTGIFNQDENIMIKTSASDVFTLPDLNRSGLMESQILNRIFGYIEHVWKDYAYTPFLKVIASCGFTPSNYITAKYWDAGIEFGCSF